MKCIEIVLSLRSHISLTKSIAALCAWLEFIYFFSFTTETVQDTIHFIAIYSGGFFVAIMQDSFFEMMTYSDIVDDKSFFLSALLTRLTLAMVCNRLWATIMDRDTQTCSIGASKPVSSILFTMTIPIMPLPTSFSLWYSWAWNVRWCYDLYYRRYRLWDEDHHCLINGHYITLDFFRRLRSIWSGLAFFNAWFCFFKASSIEYLYLTGLPGGSDDLGFESIGKICST